MDLLYVDACGGASGDMLAGALLDLGMPLDKMKELAAAMGLDEVELSVVDVEHNAIAAKRLGVHFGHQHHHRHLPDILALLDKLPQDIGQAAARVFERLAQAEAKVHGVDPSHVHFHEVGALDAIMDVSAFCAGLAWLGWPKLVCSPLPLGRGFVQAAHGTLPLPAPAVLNLLEGVPNAPWQGDKETVTPTGAALLSTLADSFGPMPAMRLGKVGIGGGSRPSQGPPNILRLILGQQETPLAADRVVEIVCHLDDMSPEDLPMVMERLMAAGALDVSASALIMKKGRLGQRLMVLSAPEESEKLAALVLEQTTSLGVRLRPVERRVLKREQMQVESPWGRARIKVAIVADEPRFHPEADDVAAICREHGLAPQKVRAELTRLAEATLGND